MRWGGNREATSKTVMPTAAIAAAVRGEVERKLRLKSLT
jgi:hypothetical protein